jgi:hypothetical protein
MTSDSCLWFCLLMMPLALALLLGSRDLWPVTVMRVKEHVRGGLPNALFGALVDARVKDEAVERPGGSDSRRPSAVSSHKLTNCCITPTPSNMQWLMSSISWCREQRMKMKPTNRLIVVQTPSTSCLVVFAL